MPASRPYQVHPAALEEFRAADDWYAEQSLDASAEFLTAIADALQKIASTPKRWPGYIFGTRRFVLQAFPFSVVYLEDPNLVRIVAIAHAKRRPGYWRKR